MITLKLIREDFETVREVVEERIPKTSGEEAEALKRILEAFKKAENEPDPEDSKLKIEMNLEEAKILRQELKNAEEELLSNP